MKTGKKIYYYILMFLYKKCGNFADQIATNSSWTYGHMKELWGDKKNMQIMYPPCDTTDIMDKIPLNNSEQPKFNYTISFAQFRPEKNHEMQLRIWKEAYPKLPPNSEFFIIGSTRAPEHE